MFHVGLEGMLHFGLEGYVRYMLYFGGIAVFFASLRRPWIGLYLIVLTLPLQTIRYRLIGLPMGNKFIDILLLGVILGVYATSGKFDFHSPLSGLLLGLTIFYYLSLWQGTFYLPNRDLPIYFDDPRFSNWKNYVELFLLCLVAMNVVKDKQKMIWLLLVMVVAILLVNKNFHSTMSDRDTSHFSYDTRTAGALGKAGENGLGAFEVMVASFFLGIGAYVKRKVVKLGILALVGTCVYAILYSFSRESYLAFAAALVLLGLLKDRKLLIAIMLVLVAWEVVLPKSVQERITMTKQDTGNGEELDSSSQERVDLWTDAFNLFKKDPIFGIGFDTYEFLHRVGRFSDTHNYYIKLLVETGIVGLALFLWLFKRVIGLGYSLYRKAEDPFWKSVGLGFLALMFSSLILNFFGDRWTYQQVDGYLWILLGCVIRGLMIVREQDEQKPMADFRMVSARPAEVPAGVLTA